MLKSSKAEIQREMEFNNKNDRLIDKRKPKKPKTAVLRTSGANTFSEKT